MDQVVNIIKKIYLYEFEVRFAFRFDLDYSWFLIDPNKPSRLAADIVKSENGLPVLIDFKEDWIACGNCPTFEEAVYQAADAICANFPGHAFVEWFADEVIIP